MANKNITLGSGKLYAVKATKSGSTYTIPEGATTEANLLGYIKGGAKLTYTSESYTAKDDLGLVSKTITTSETATLTSGLMTWNYATLETLVATAREAAGSTEGSRKLLIGGIDNADNAPYVIIFRHEDKADNRFVQVTILGTSTGELEIAFASDSETVLDAEFTAQPGVDNEGTLIIYEEGTLA